MNDLMIFEGHEVEVLEIKGQVLFNPHHVAECLEIADVKSSIRKFNSKQLVKVKNSDVHSMHFRKLNNTGENFITESGVYKLVFKSRKPNAEAFTDWIADEVLPTIRKTGSYEIPKKEKPKTKNLSSTNMLVKIIGDVFAKAGVSPLFIAAETKRLYKEEAGIDINIPLITDKATMSKLYDNTEMAKELGVLSSTGNPHSQAIGAILKKLHIEESEIVTTAFSRNGHDDVTIQYKPSVFKDVKLWLKENGYPTKVSYVDSKGNPKTCTVVYREVA